MYPDIATRMLIFNKIKPYFSGIPLVTVFMTLLSVTVHLEAQVSSGVASVSAESTVYADGPSGNGGAYDKFCMGNLASLGSTRRGYMRFDLPQIPSGASVTRVVMVLNQEKVRVNGVGAPKAATLQLHRVNAAWTEGSSGNQMEACGGGAGGDGINWSNVPDHVSAMSATAALSGATNVLITLDTDIGSDDDGLINDVQAWVNNGASNFGWLARIAEEEINNNARLMEIVSLTVYWTTGGGGGGIAINPGLNDAWFDPATPGQGFFVTVFPDIQQIFLAWFTYDLTRPPGSVSAQLGEPGHRWLTAFGPYSGNEAVLDIELTQGGVFDSATPAPSQSADGSILLEFSDCNAGTVTYDIDSANLQGVIAIQRIAVDNVPFCESFAAQIEQSK